MEPERAEPCVEPAALEALEALRRGCGDGATPAAWGVAGEDAPASAQDAELLAAAPPGDADVESGGALRCLDKTHAADCCACTPAPPEEEMNDYKLVAHGALKHGERTLRSQLVFSREWSCAAERAQLAKRLARTPGTERLVTLLTRKDCAALRKGDLIALSRAWGYKSCIWVRKRRADATGTRPSGAAAMPAPAGHAGALVALTSGQGGGADAGGSAVAAAAALALSSAVLRDRSLLIADGALAAYVARHLTPLFAAANVAFQGHGMRAALLSQAAAGAVTPAYVAAHTARSTAWRPVALSFAALVRAQRAAVTARLAALDAPTPGGASGADADAADAPAWRALACASAPAEEEFRTLSTMHSVGDAAISEIVAAAAPDDAVAVALGAEGHAGHRASLELAAAAGALLAQAKLGPLRGYVAVAAVLLELLSHYCDEAHDALLFREAWLGEAERLAAAAAAPGTPPAELLSAPGAAKAAPGEPGHVLPPQAAAAALTALPALAPVEEAMAAMPEAPPPAAAMLLPAPRVNAALMPPAAAAPLGPSPPPAGHFVRIWQSLLYHGVRPGLTAP